MSGLRNVCALTLVVGLAAAASAQDKSKFETVFEKDKAFYQQVSSTVDQTVKVVGGAELKLNHTQKFMFKWTPLKLEADKWTVKLTLEGIVLNVDVASQVVQFDSTKADAAGGANNQVLTDFFKNLVGLEYTVTFGKGMVVEKVDGKDQLLQKLAGVNPQMEAVLKKMLSEEAVKEMCDPTAGLALNPPGEKATGEKWAKVSTLPLGPVGNYERTLSYEYKGKDAVAKEQDRVEVTTKLTYKAPAADADGLLFKIKGGTLESVDPKPGYYLFDPKTGRVTKAELKVTMKGALDVAIGSTESKVDLTQTQLTTFETADKSFVPEKK